MAIPPAFQATSLCTREAFKLIVKPIAEGKPAQRLPLERKLSPKVTDEVDK